MSRQSYRASLNSGGDFWFGSIKTSSLKSQFRAVPHPPKGLTDILKFELLTVKNKMSSMHPGESDAKLVKNLWDDEKCPYYDMIMFSNGKIFPLNLVEDAKSGMCTVESENWIPASEIKSVNNCGELNEGFAVICEVNLINLNLKIIGGECFSSGENGFLALTEFSSGKFMWVIFLVSSNPFSNIDIQDNLLMAKSTSGKIFRVLLSYPENLQQIAAI